MIATVLSPSQTRIWRAFATAPDGRLAHDDVVAAAYDGRTPPEHARAATRVHVQRLRTRLGRFGISFVTVPGGYAFRREGRPHG